MPICGLFRFTHDERGEKQLAEAQDIFTVCTQSDSKVVSDVINFLKKKLKMCVYLCVLGQPSRQEDLKLIFQH